MPGSAGVTNDEILPPSIGPVRNDDASSGESVGVWSPSLTTVTVVPGCTVMGVPNAKFLIVIVLPITGARLVAVAIGEVGEVGEVGAAPDFALELHAVPIAMVASTAVARPMRVRVVNVMASSVGVSPSTGRPARRDESRRRLPSSSGG